MFNARTALALAIVFFVSSGCASLRPEGVSASAERAWFETAESVQSELKNPRYADTIWSVEVVNLRTGDTVYEMNAESNMIPASNTKIYTTATALDQLGPDYFYTTTVVTNGTIRDGTLEGDLIVTGSGDPVIGGRFNEGNILATFESWADSLAILGVSEIHGDIIGDDNVFDDVPLGPGWMWDDETGWYSAQVSALSFNDNCVDITVAGTIPGEPAHLSWEPANTPYVTILNKTQTLHPDSSFDNLFDRERETNRIHVGSLVPADRSTVRSITISNPTLYFVSVLRETLERKGIRVYGYPIDIDQMEAADYETIDQWTVASHRSVPMSEIVKAINKPSHNLYADMVLKTVGLERNRMLDLDEPGSWTSGIDAVLETLGRAGADTSVTQLVDGSGLSRYNLVRSGMTMSLLKYMWNHDDRNVFSAFYESLPIGGIDGTLSGRYPAGSARGNVHAKTGTVSNVSTLAGYVNSADGTPLAFVIMANHFSVPTSEVRSSQDFVVEQLANLQLQRR
ncbi:MAG: D-alanyl-D-alanine carboxypeptidase/D-alanyl-D-alanine-endopeptidase [Rhodothermales bacterium]|nr:D-alanyl-D-alanine carboxypeptidase/D-alanyl-D-alanine-endopeptidase [Rhodothermales bacterium]